MIDGSLRVLWFLPPLKLVAMTDIAESGVKHNKSINLYICTSKSADHACHVSDYVIEVACMFSFDFRTLNRYG
jgi:hypothetical protein